MITLYLPRARKEEEEARAEHSQARVHVDSKNARRSDPQHEAFDSKTLLAKKRKRKEESRVNSTYSSAVMMPF
jgi:hypothetical protein